MSRESVVNLEKHRVCVCVGAGLHLERKEKRKTRVSGDEL